MERFLRNKFVLFDERRLRMLRAVDMFDEVVKFVGNMSQYLGAYAKSLDFHWNYRTWLAVVLLASFFLSFVYSVIINWRDWFVIMDIMSMTGPAFQGTIKLYCVTSRVEYFQRTHRNLRIMYDKYSSHPENNLVLVRCAILIHYLCRTMLVLYAGASLLVLGRPLIVFLMTHERLLPIPLSFIFTDTSTPVGFMISIVYLTVLILLAVPALVIADSAILLIVLQIVGIANVFKNSLSELDQMLDDPNCTQKEIHEKVTEICMMHDEIIKYEEGLDTTYYHTVFVQMLSSILGISLILFLIFVMKDWTKIMYLGSSSFQLIEFCVLGTSLTVKNQEIMTAIYDTKWYLLSVSEQKRILLILHRSQNAVEMTIGGLYLLNMETFVEISKTIYSYFTMIISFLE